MAVDFAVGEKNVCDRWEQWSDNPFAPQGAALRGRLLMWDPVNSNCIL